MRDFDILEQRDNPSSIRLLPRPALYRFQPQTMQVRYLELKTQQELIVNQLSAQVAASNASLLKILGR
jgi:hypothetical protein